MSSCLDAHVTGLLLAAMAPAALEISLAAAGQMEAQRAQAGRIWRQRLERAESAAGRARRQYQLAEPARLPGAPRLPRWPPPRRLPAWRALN